MLVYGTGARAAWSRLFCLEPEPELTQLRRSQSRLRDFGLPEPEPPLFCGGSATLNCSVSYNVNCKAVCCGFQKMTTGYGSRILPHFASERSENTCSKRISYIIKTKRIFFFQIVFFKNQLILRKNVPFKQW